VGDLDVYKLAQERHWFLEAIESGWIVYADWIDMDEGIHLGEGATVEDALLDAAKGLGLLDSEVSSG
jgi:hypothetical protein